jgi:hypothetical protein
VAEELLAPRLTFTSSRQPLGGNFTATDRGYLQLLQLRDC